MSSLTSETKLVYVPMIYDSQHNKVDELGESYSFKYAVEAAMDAVAERIAFTGEHYSAKIEAQIVPLYI